MKILTYMPELVGFQTIVILDPEGTTFDAVGAFGPVFQLLFKSGPSYCDKYSKARAEILKLSHVRACR